MSQTAMTVIAEEPVESPLSTPEKPMFFTRIRRLLLADETTVYACGECDFTAPSVGAVRVHLRTHKTSGGGNGHKQTPLDLTLGELLEQHRRAETLAATVDRQAAELRAWKVRARDAEQDLETLRRVFQGVAK